MLTSLSKTKGSIFRFFEIMKITAETNTNFLAIRCSGGYMLYRKSYICILALLESIFCQGFVCKIP